MMKIGENGKNGINCGRDVRPARLDHVNFFTVTVFVIVIHI